MKKIVVIFLLFQIITNNAFAEELVKFPMLFTHFYHHSHEHNDTKGFVDYLVQHYSDNHEENEHDEEDNDCHLPFKHCDGCCVNSHVPLIAFVPVVEETNYVLFQSPEKKYMFENEKIISLFASSIWQPPKIKPIFS